MARGVAPARRRAVPAHAHPRARGGAAVPRVARRRDVAVGAPARAESRRGARVGGRGDVTADRARVRRDRDHRRPVRRRVRHAAPRPRPLDRAARVAGARRLARRRGGGSHRNQVLGGPVRAVHARPRGAVRPGGASPRGRRATAAGARADSAGDRGGGGLHAALVHVWILARVRGRCAGADARTAGRDAPDGGGESRRARVVPARRDVHDGEAALLRRGDAREEPDRLPAAVDGRGRDRGAPVAIGRRSALGRPALRRDRGAGRGVGVEPESRRALRAAGVRAPLGADRAGDRRGMARQRHAHRRQARDDRGGAGVARRCIGRGAPGLPGVLQRVRRSRAGARAGEQRPRLGAGHRSPRRPGAREGDRLARARVLRQWRAVAPRAAARTRARRRRAAERPVARGERDRVPPAALSLRARAVRATRVTHAGGVGGQVDPALRPRRWRSDGAGRNARSAAHARLRARARRRRRRGRRARSPARRARPPRGPAAHRRHGPRGRRC